MSALPGTEKTGFLGRVMQAVRRNPEGLLLLAAGSILSLRGVVSDGSVPVRPVKAEAAGDAGENGEAAANGRGGDATRVMPSASTKSAKEPPVAIAFLGLAAGAALAGMFSARAERSYEAGRDRLGQSVSKARTRLGELAEENGWSQDRLMHAAGEVARAFGEGLMDGNASPAGNRRSRSARKKPVARSKARQPDKASNGKKRASASRSRNTRKAEASATNDTSSSNASDGAANV